MLSRTRARHHVVVAYLALFVALGGSAVAAKPLIDGSGVRDESLTSADIQNDSLTGEDILESSLGKVGDADTLDGKGSTDFAGSGQSCDAGDVVTGISASGKIVCSGTGEGGGETPTQDFCNGVDEDSDGTEGEDHPGSGQEGPNGGTLQCVGGNFVEVGGNTTDADGDGVTVGEGDCDDGDPDIPSAEEHDGKDNDCDGNVDEGFSGPIP